MSRICVKNLTKDAKEVGLREFFSTEGGQITDVKLMRTKDGKSRQFAFIGFRSDDDAQVAIKHYNNNYYQRSRITCEVAKKRGDPNLSRPWSRYSEKKDNKVTTPDANKHLRAKGQGDKSKDFVENDDPKLQDFLQVMQPRAISKLWGNDTSIVSNVSNNLAIPNKDIKGTSDAIHPILVESSLLVVGLPNNPEPNQSRELENDVVISDMDYFKSRVTSEWSDSENSDSEDDSDDDNDSVCIDDKDNHSHVSEHEENCDKNPSERIRRKGAQELNLEGQEDRRGEGVTRDEAEANATEQEGQSSNPEDARGVFKSC
ncbi:hypothetical protein OROGR_020470 [Orobanche gracilis]